MGLGAIARAKVPVAWQRGHTIVGTGPRPHRKHIQARLSAMGSDGGASEEEMGLVFVAMEARAGIGVRGEAREVAPVWAGMLGPVGDQGVP